jgi:hypothetical protein
MVGRKLGTGLVLAILGWGMLAGPKLERSWAGGDKGAASYEDLLTQANLSFTKEKSSDGQTLYKITTVDANGDASVIYSSIREWGWTYPRKKGSPKMKVAYLDTLVHRFQQGDKIPKGLERTLNDLNGRLPLSQCYITNNVVLITQQAFLPIDADHLHYQYWNVHWNRMNSRKAVQAVISAANAEK